jgi:hypothetical protein
MVKLKHDSMVGTGHVDAEGQQFIITDGVVEVPESVAVSLRNAGWIDVVDEPIEETEPDAPAKKKAKGSEELEGAE